MAIKYYVTVNKEGAETDSTKYDLVTTRKAEYTKFAKEELIDGGGNVILEGRDKIESDTGILDWDGEYNTDIVKYLSECSDSEIGIIYQAYLDDEYMDDDLKDYVCTQKGMHRIDKVKFYQCNAEIQCQDCTISYFWDGEEDVTEEEIAEWMEEQDIDPLSIKNHADSFESHFYKD